MLEIELLIDLKEFVKNLNMVESLASVTLWRDSEEGKSLRRKRKRYFSIWFRTSDEQIPNLLNKRMRNNISKLEQGVLETKLGRIITSGDIKIC